MEANRDGMFSHASRHRPSGQTVTLVSGHIVDLVTHDARFPTSSNLAGSDAMNPDPDYSAAYVRLVTDVDDLEGHGFVFTIGRGNDVARYAIDSLRSAVVGLSLNAALDDLSDVSQRLIRDSQLRWLGPEKGVMHMAIGAIVNALWDLRAKRDGKPLWKLLSDLSPEEIVGLVDFRYLTDVLRPDEALAILKERASTRSVREADLVEDGLSAYTTAPGWLGYADDKLVTLCKQAVDHGFEQVKLKVGGDLHNDIRRLSLAREVLGPNFAIAVDANQRWDVDEAVGWIEKLAPFGLAWVEEPTCPDDVVGHAEIAKRVSPIRIATGEHAHNRVMFKQLLRLGGTHVVQIDATRVAGVNENLAILLLAAKYGVPVCPHAGGVGLSEVVQHLAMFDYVAVGGSRDGRMIEYADSLHEHFVDPVVVEHGRYRAPTRPGSGATIKTESLANYAFPTGPVWQEREPT